MNEIFAVLKAQDLSNNQIISILKCYEKIQDDTELYTEIKAIVNDDQKFEIINRALGL